MLFFSHILNYVEIKNQLKIKYSQYNYVKGHVKQCLGALVKHTKKENKK
jgi:hypothetical protein